MQEINIKNPGNIIFLGRRGEHLAKQIRFDLSYWIAEYGDGTVQLIYQRATDATPYPIAMEHDGRYATWTVSATDTNVVGNGRAELRWYGADELLAKSVTWLVQVSDALGDAGDEPPEPEQSWVDRVLRAGVAAAQSAAEAAESKRGAETAEANAEASADAARTAQTAAETARDDARKSATAAAGSATNADISAKNADASAGAANQAKASAETAAENAGASASAAAGSAANADTSAKNAEASAGAANQAKASAETAAENAGASASAAAGSVTNAATSEANAQASAVAAAQSAVEADAKATEVAGILTDVNQLKTSLAANAKADKKTADKLDALWKLSNGISYDFVTDSEEAYTKDIPSGASYAALSKIGGKTVVWNQYAKQIKSSTKNGVTFTNNGDGTYSVSGETGSTNSFLTVNGVDRAVKSHVYMVKGLPENNDASILRIWVKVYSDSTVVFTSLFSVSGWHIFTQDGETGVFNVYFRVGNNIVVDTTVSPALIDLTQLFGAGNEPTTTDDPRIAWIDAYVAEHFEYNAGELISAGVESVSGRGRNMFDPSWISSLDDATEEDGVITTSILSLYNKFGKSGASFPVSCKTNTSYILDMLANAPTEYSLPRFIFTYADTTTKEELAIQTTDELTRYSYTTTQDKSVTRFSFSYATRRNSLVAFKNIQLYEAGQSADYLPYKLIEHKIPAAVQELPGYGWSTRDAANTIERTDAGWQYVQRVSSRDYQDGDTMTDGATTYYALDTPVITDITDLMLDFPDIIPVEATGLLTFKNTLNLPVPSTVEYVRKLTEVTT